MRCSQPDHSTLENGDGSLHPESPVRRFPRVGAQFQTRISKSTGPSIRPAPDRMSTKYPFLSENETEQYRGIEVNALQSLSIFRPTKNDDACSGVNLPESKSCRGGSLVYAPAKDGGQFLEFLQPFVTSTRDQARTHITNEAWIQHMIHLHSTESTGKRSRASRGGVKRKRPDNEELVWNLENILERLKKSNNDNAGYDMFGEEQALVLEKLRLFYGGNLDAAQFDVLVKLSGGQALKMRKREEKERTKKRSKTPSQQTSESWRDMYEISTLPYVRTVLGQLQDDHEPSYTVKTNEVQELNHSWSEHSNVNLMLEPDDSKGAWRSILACGKSIERQLNSDSVGDRRPLLCTLLTFVSRAYALPTPESCFGTHHVMVEEVSNTIISILNHVKNAQNVHAKIRDKVFDESTTGIDSDDLIKFLDTEYSTLPIRLTEGECLYKFRDTVVEWESRLVRMLDVNEEELENTENKNYLAIAENMQREANGHGYKSKALVQLNSRLRKAYDLRQRILRWKCAGATGKMTTIKTVSAFVKEAKRIKLFSPEVLEIFEFHRVAEEWVDRANIAIRSKISLDEIQNLIRRGEDIPIDLSEHIEKLKTRVRIAEEWLEALDEIVPLKTNGYDALQLWESLQSSLQNGNHSKFHELSSEGNRIPVDVVAVKLLQLALDAKNWTTKAQKWTPNNPDSKKGKLSDLREHLEKISTLRSKLPLSETQKNNWKPPGENELASIIVAADSWLQKYSLFLSGDNRRNDERSCLAMNKLRTIVEEGSAIYVNMGNSISKITRILAQAQAWYQGNLTVLERCGISSCETTAPGSNKQSVGIDEMTAAVEAARLDIALDLDEALKLRKLLERSKTWNERVGLIAPKRNKRNGRGGRSKFTLKDLIDLIEESSYLPIDTDENVHRLQIQLNAIETWRAEALKQLQDIGTGFSNLKAYVDDVYGDAEDYSIDRISEVCHSDDESTADDTATSSSDKFATEKKRDGDEMEIGSNFDSEEDTSMTVRGSNSALNVVRLVKELNEEAKGISVSTMEGDTGELLDGVSKWCTKSFKYLNSPREVFDKRYFGAFDRFILEGEDLCKTSIGGGENSEGTICNEVDGQLKKSWERIVKDQLLRLMILKAEREKFEEWCKRASKTLGDKKELTVEKLTELAESSRHFPANRDLVSKIRGLSAKVSRWKKTTKSLLESGEKIDLQDAKNLLETGEKLKVQTEELKKLRAEIRAARNWATKAKECNLEQGSIHVNDVKDLIDEHENLLIEMPDELEVLKQATVGYCICRRPYEGFMIGCDHCEEWYHGPCIGISESKADRVEKFTCIRCSTRRIFHNSAACAVGIVRKWTCRKDFKKARQIESQKLQRKERKERKDIEKLTGNIKRLEEQISQLKCKTNLNEPFRSTLDIGASVAEEMKFPVDSIPEKNDNRVEQSDELSVNISPVENGKSGSFTNDENQLLSSTNTTCATSFENTIESVGKEPLHPDNAEGDKAQVAHSADGIAHNQTDAKSAPLLNEADLMSKVEKDRTALQQSTVRLDKVIAQSNERLCVEASEDRYSNDLRHWCIRVRSEVLLPSTDAESERTRPSANGDMPSIMDEVIVEAKTLGILGLPDVKKMIDCFKSMCWSISALDVLRRKPSITQFRHLVSEASKFKLPDEKALRTMKFMTNKASQLQSKISKALSPKAGEKKPFNVSVLKGLESGIRELPLFIPEEEILRNAIGEDGARHCTCGAPRDRTKMIDCGACNECFHLKCIATAGSSEVKWLCPSCGSSLTPDETICADSFIVDSRFLRTKKHVKSSSNGEVSPHAPDPVKLWPPFGLTKSDAAIEAFGLDCLAINDEAKREPQSTTQLDGASALNVRLPSEQVLSKGAMLSSDVTPMSNIQSCISTNTSKPASAECDLDQIQPEAGKGFTKPSQEIEKTNSEISDKGPDHDASNKSPNSVEHPSASSTVTKTDIAEADPSYSAPLALSGGPFYSEEMGKANLEGKKRSENDDSNDARGTNEKSASSSVIEKSEYTGVDLKHKAPDVDKAVGPFEPMKKRCRPSEPMDAVPPEASPLNEQCPASLTMKIRDSAEADPMLKASPPEPMGIVAPDVDDNSSRAASELKEQGSSSCTTCKSEATDTGLINGACPSSDPMEVVAPKASGLNEASSAPSTMNKSDSAEVDPTFKASLPEPMDISTPDSDANSSNAASELKEQDSFSCTICKSEATDTGLTDGRCPSSDPREVIVSPRESGLNGQSSASLSTMKKGDSAEADPMCKASLPESMDIVAPDADVNSSNAISELKEEEATSTGLMDGGCLSSDPMEVVVSPRASGLNEQFSVSPAIRADSAPEAGPVYEFGLSEPIEIATPEGNDSSLGVMAELKVPCSAIATTIAEHKPQNGTLATSVDSHAPKVDRQSSRQSQQAHAKVDEDKTVIDYERNDVILNGAVHLSNPSEELLSIRSPCVSQSTTQWNETESSSKMDDDLNGVASDQCTQVSS